MNKKDYTDIKRYIENLLGKDGNNYVKPQTEKDIKEHIKLLGVYFCLTTGCRPNEAAHIIYYN